MKATSENLPSWSIRLPVYLIRSVIGFNLGLIVYSYALLLLEALERANGGEPVAAYGLVLYPLEWVGFCIAFGIFLIAFLEIPTGILADSIGRKFAVITAGMMRMLMFCCLIIIWRLCESESPLGSLIISCALVFEFLSATAFAFSSGSFLAWLVDSLENENKSSWRTFMMTRSLAYHAAITLPGALVGLFAVLNGYELYAYLTGGFLEIFLAVFLYFGMQENKQYQFSGALDVFKGRAKQVFGDAAVVWAAAIKVLLSRPVLWVIFLTTSAHWGLRNLVAWLWPVFCKARFPNQLERFSTEWIVLVMAFGVSNFLGAFVLSRWMFKQQGRQGGAAQGKRLVWLTLLIYLASATAIVLLAIVLSLDISVSANLTLFLVLLALFHLLKEGVRAVSDSLHNEFIPANTKERSTVLSLGSMLISSIAAVFVFFGTGDKASSMLWWLLPALVLAGMTLLQTFVCLRKLRVG